GALGLVAIAELTVPDAPEVGLELGSLVGRHRRRTLELRDLQHHVPLAAARMDAAQLAQGRAVRPVETGERPVGLAGCVEVEDAVLEDLSESEQQRALLRGVLLERGGGEATAVDADQRGPVAFEEEVLLERLEGAAI